jgi:hypothetical protein
MPGSLLVRQAPEGPTSLKLLLQRLSAEKMDAVVVKLVKQRSLEPIPMSN